MDTLLSYIISATNENSQNTTKNAKIEKSRCFLKTANREMELQLYLYSSITVDLLECKFVLFCYVNQNGWDNNISGSIVEKESAINKQ